jgi:hypothetical protein
MKQLRILFALILILGGSRVFAQKVNIDYDKQASFQGMKTYAWAKGTPLSNQLWDQRIIDGIDQRMAAKGFQKVDGGASPDLYVLYHGAVGQETQLNTMDMGGGWGWRWGGAGGMTTTTVQKIPVGQLVVDIGDAKTRKLMWMANSSDTLSDNPKTNQKKLNKALDKIFKKFPPPPGK